jgi:predicted AAA+ superfamily ATPase
VLSRKAWQRLQGWHDARHYRALLVSGARQVGKTYVIREFAKATYRHCAELNLLENTAARDAFGAAKSANDLFARLSVFADAPLVPGETLIFIDEVQECKEIITQIKFLAEREDFDYILSGSLLGIELRNVHSTPVGFLDELTMFPLDFEEFCWASGISEDVFSLLRELLGATAEVPDFLHDRLLRLYHQYLVVGGMPDAVAEFQSGQNVQLVRQIQRNIIAQYKMDAAKYNPERQMPISRIYDLIPKELDAQNKRFKVKDIDGKTRLSRYEDDFLWLCDAGVALPAYNAREPRYPLMLNMDTSYFKLFLSDVGMLTCAIGMDATREMLSGRNDVNYGSLYENAVAQELVSQGYDLYYFKNKNLGELDFLVEHNNSVLPVEVKSGKSYTRHSALNKLLYVENYSIDRAVVLHEGNSSKVGAISYLPIYMAGLLGDL